MTQERKKTFKLLDELRMIALDIRDIKEGNIEGDKKELKLKAKEIKKELKVIKKNTEDKAFKKFLDDELNGETYAFLWGMAIG